jgi:hypothetical protein
LDTMFRRKLLALDFHTPTENFKGMYSVERVPII